MSKKYYISAQYCFYPQNSLEALKAELLDVLQNNNIQGTLLIAPEGINGTVASTSQSAIKTLQTYLTEQYPAIVFKNSVAEHNLPPFYRAKVVIKKEIVGLGEPDLQVHKKTGAYVQPKDWNALINDPNVLLIDTRNDYEYKIGTFQNAQNPHTKTFREFPKFVKQHVKRDQKIAMFCTGGIRCEKASSWLLEKGYQNVYQLDGGILNYLESVDQKDSLWQGECFVFDNRVSVDHKLKPGHYNLCHGCRQPITEQEKQSPLYQAGVSCPYCYDQLSTEQKKRFKERHKQVQLAKQKGQAHIGQTLQAKNT